MENTEETSIAPTALESDNREPLRVNLIGSPYAVTCGIRAFSKIGFAKNSEWSDFSPAHKPGLVQSALTRYLPKQ